jgi:hypothetical protein
MEGFSMFYCFRPQRRRARPAAGRSTRRGNLGWLRPAALATLLVGLSSLGGLIPETPLPSYAAEPQMVQPGASRPQPPPPPQESPLDQPLRMIGEARQVYGQVRDYQCILITQERVKGILNPEEVIQLSFRRDPFSVWLKWLAPKAIAGQEACYVSGKNQNKMKALKASGFGRGFGWVSLAVDDPMVKDHSRHQITETGFGNLIDRFDKSWTEERPLNKNRVQIAEYEYNQRRCYRVETTHTDFDKRFYCYRSVVYFDKETKMPVRAECYDWPRQNGQTPDGELLECFSYINLQFNVNLPDATFNK